jgi:hypothetical protein
LSRGTLVRTALPRSLLDFKVSCLAVFGYGSYVQLAALVSLSEKIEVGNGWTIDLCIKNAIV